MITDLRQPTMGAVEFAQFGGESFVFIKPVRQDDKLHYLVCAADGTELWAVEDRDLAVVIARRQGFEPLSLH